MINLSYLNVSVLEGKSESPAMRSRFIRTAALDAAGTAVLAVAAVTATST